MLSRREALLGLGGAIASAALTFAPKNSYAIPDGQGGWPWKAQKLDSQKAAQYAYDGFYEQGQGCCYGAFRGLVGLMGKTYGAPYNTFPLQMMVYGASGVSNWGTLCGALNGAAAAFGLFWKRSEQEPMVDDLFSWYEATKFPTFSPSKPKLDYKVPPTVPGSVLCHVSVSKWAAKTGNDMHSKERSERCARVTADVAKKAAEIINAKLEGSAFHILPNEGRGYCGKCHGKGLEADIAKGKMDCRECHDGGLKNMFKDHP